LHGSMYLTGILLVEWDINQIGMKGVTVPPALIPAPSCL
jgi:hypothetical protein